MPEDGRGRKKLHKTYLREKIFAMNRGSVQAYLFGKEKKRKVP